MSDLASRFDESGGCHPHRNILSDSFLLDIVGAPQSDPVARYDKSQESRCRIPERQRSRFTFHPALAFNPYRRFLLGKPQTPGPWGLPLGNFICSAGPSYTGIRPLLYGEELLLCLRGWFGLVCLTRWHLHVVLARGSCPSYTGKSCCCAYVDGLAWCAWSDDICMLSLPGWFPPRDTY